MLIKKLYFSHYNQIKKLIKKNNSTIPNYNFWIKLWNNKKSVVGEGLFHNKKLVGYHSEFKKKLIYNKKKYSISVSSNWNVEKKFRRNSLILINRFFNNKSDLLMTTTANKNVATIWKSFGALEINNRGCQQVFFKILDYNNFTYHFLKKKNLTLLTPLNPILGLLSKYFFYNKKLSLKKNYNFSYKKCSLKEINKFNKNYEKNNKYPKEERLNNTLGKYLEVIKHNKIIYKLKICYQEKFIGYAILVKENNNPYKIRRMFLAEIRLEKKFYIYLDEIFNEISIFSKYQNCTLIEFKNLNLNIFQKLNKRKYFVRNYNFNPYLIKFNSNKSNLLKKYVNSYWDTSYLDGDSLL